MDACIFDSALSHTRRSDASKKKKIFASTYDQICLWTSFESSPVSVKELKVVSLCCQPNKLTCAVIWFGASSFSLFKFIVIPIISSETPPKSPLGSSKERRWKWAWSVHWDAGNPRSQPSVIWEQYRLFKLDRGVILVFGWPEPDSVPSRSQRTVSNSQSKWPWIFDIEAWQRIYLIRKIISSVSK